MYIKLSKIKAYEKGGKVYAYDRVSGEALQNVPKRINGVWHGSPEVVAELARLRASIPVDGTLSAAIADYKTKQEK